MATKGNTRTAERWIRQAAQAGWNVRETKAGWRLESPDGVSTTAWHRSGGSDERALKNFRAQLRRGWPDGLPGCP